ncbi:MAG: SCO family protein [Planctomycetota bacterium]|jgi:protein SCO1/2
MRHVAILLLLLAAACGDGASTPAVIEHDTADGTVESTDLLKLREVPAFDLTERDGKAFGKEAMAGKVWVACFIFTRCQGICIPMCDEMKRLQDEFREEKDFAIVATSVDPAYDTPDVLRRFATKKGAEEGRWFFLTGGAETIKEFAYEGLKLPGHPLEIKFHSNYLVLVDRQGTVRGYYKQAEIERMEKMRKDIRVLLAEKTP